MTAEIWWWGGESYFRSDTHVAEATDVLAESSPYGTVMLPFGPARVRGREPLVRRAGMEKQRDGTTHSRRPELSTPELNE